jgi:hypothetical protein
MERKVIITHEVQAFSPVSPLLEDVGFDAKIKPSNGTAEIRSENISSLSKKPSYKRKSDLVIHSSRGLQALPRKFILLTLCWTTAAPFWIPISLRIPFLIAVILVSIALIVILQLLLVLSQRNGGVLFAPNINDLPVLKTFPYLYLPTIVAVCYGFLWNWIDLDVRRIEPFFQLAKDGGATGRESLLLHYPVDFLASVPIKALNFG